MNEKRAKGIIIVSFVFVVISFLSLIGQLVYNIRRITIIDSINISSILLASVFVLGSIGLVLYIVVASYLPLLKKEAMDQTKYLNLLVVALVYRIILYVLFELISLTWNGGIGGFLNEFHYATYVLVEKTDLLPIAVFPLASLSFIHTLLAADILGVGLVVLGFVLSKKDKYAPMMAVVVSILINIIAIFVINILIIRNYGVDFIFYKLDAALATMITEFAMLGYIIHNMFILKKK